ncbi:MAG: hypothetical protein O6931_02885 [Gammaproteobacteria bacterium]|nr:hypothetical protein [Gammaproteobacteria bacterium]
MSSKLEKLITAAREQFGVGDWREGQKFLGQAGDLAPDDPRVLDIVGRLRLQRGEINGALEALEAALRLDPGEKTSTPDLHQDETDHYQNHQPWMASMFERLGELS